MDDIAIYTNNAENIIIFELPDGRSETYSMNRIPDRDSFIIRKMMEQVCQELQIQTIVDNLNNIVELLFVAENALAGTKVCSQVTRIQEEYMKLCGSSKLTVHELCIRCRKVAQNIGKAYDNLIMAREPECIRKLKECESVALEMAGMADTLAQNFVKLGDLSDQAVMDTEDEAAVQKEMAEKLQKDRDDYKAKLDAQVAMQDSFNEQLADLNNAYQEAKKKEDDALKRKHGYEIAGIVSGIAGGIVDLFTPDLGNFGKKKDSQAQDEARQEISEMKQELADVEKEYEQKLDEKQKLEQQNSELEAKIKNEQQRLEDLSAAGKEGSDDAASLQNMLDNDKILLATCGSELAAAVEAAELLSKKMADLKDTLTAMTEQFEKVSTSAAAEAEKAAQQKEKIYDDKIEIEKQRRESLSQIAEFTSMIESCSQQQHAAETALHTLNMAAVCIKQVVASFLTASMFWKSVSSFCNTLHDSDLDETIQANIDYCPQESRVVYYYDSEFMCLMLQFLSQWGALYYVCKDYETAISDIPKRQANYYKKPVKLADACQIAMDVSRDLSDKVKTQMEAQDAVIMGLEQNKKGIER